MSAAANNQTFWRTDCNLNTPVDLLYWVAKKFLLLILVEKTYIHECIMPYFVVQIDFGKIYVKQLKHLYIAAEGNTSKLYFFAMKTLSSTF